MKITAWLPQEIPGAHSWHAGLRVAGWWGQQQAESGGRNSKNSRVNSCRKQSGFMLCPHLQTSQQRNDSKLESLMS